MRQLFRRIVQGALALAAGFAFVSWSSLTTAAAASSLHTAGQPRPEFVAQRLMWPDIKTFVVGTWMTSISEVVNGVTWEGSATVIYQPNGTFTGIRTVHRQGTAGTTTRLSGRWSAVRLGETSFTLTETSAAAGTVTYKVTILDHNTARNDTTGSIYHRVQ